jgi:phospholipid/cholesterol/gamma-HCH transport system substrate-binding protein
METKANYVAVGAFVLACMIGFVVTIMWLAGMQYSQEYEYFQTNFKGSVSGLGKGTLVRYNGIEVGRVDTLTFNPDDPQSVIVTLQVQPDLNIRTNSEASIESEGITGGSYVEISGGTANAPRLVAREGQRYPVIKTKQSTLRQLEQNLPQLLAKLNTIADRLNGVLSEENRATFTAILSNLNDTTATLAARSEDISKTLKNASAASDRLGPTLAEAEASLKKFDQLAAHADDFVTGPGLAQVGDLMADMRRLTSSLKKLSDDLGKNPTKLLFGDRREGYTPKGAAK